MKKCRVLLEENQSLGRQISEGPIQDLLVALGHERQQVKQLSERLKKAEKNEQILDEENEKLSAQVESLTFQLSAAGGERETGGSSGRAESGERDGAKDERGSTKERGERGTKDRKANKERKRRKMSEERDR